jgi:hypothetical protein
MAVAVQDECLGILFPASSNGLQKTIRGALMQMPGQDEAATLRTVDFDVKSALR